MHPYAYTHTNQFIIRLGPHISRKRCHNNWVAVEKRVKHFIVKPTIIKRNVPLVQTGWI